MWGTSSPLLFQGSTALWAGHIDLEDPRSHGSTHHNIQCSNHSLHLESTLDFLYGCF